MIEVEQVWLSRAGNRFKVIGVQADLIMVERLNAPKWDTNGYCFAARQFDGYGLMREYGPAER